MPARKHTIEYVRQKGLEKGFYLNSEAYINCMTALNWSCVAEWHMFPSSWNNIDQNKGCPYCAGLKKHTIEYVRKIGLEKGFYLNSETYPNSKALLSWSCLSEWHHTKKRFNDIDQGQGCPGCCDNLGWQTDFYAYLVKHFPHLLTEQRVLKNKRFRTDVWDPVNRKALELDGDYWHDRPRNREIDARKNKEYEELKIELLRIRFYEWQKDPDFWYKKALCFFSSLTVT